MMLKEILQNAKWKYLALILVLGLFIASVTTTQAVNRKAKNSKKVAARVDDKQQAAEQNEKLSAWDIIEMTDWLFWPFVLLTASGLFLLTYKGLQEYQEKSRSRWLLEQKIGTGDLRRVVRLVQTSQPNRASRLMHQIIATFNKTNRAEPIGDDINTYLTAERDSFETFNRVLGFLSDTAGALGLLGTVWGIFETFHAGKLDGPTILKGMSISLVTTLVGLIISLVLNMGATGIFAFFNRQLNLLATRAEELRQALLYLEMKQSRGNGTPPSPPRPEPQHEPAYAMAEKAVRRQPAAEPVFAGEQSGVVRDDNGYF